MRYLIQSSATYELQCFRKRHVIMSSEFLKLKVSSLDGLCKQYFTRFEGSHYRPFFGNIIAIITCECGSGSASFRVVNLYVSVCVFVCSCSDM